LLFRIKPRQDEAAQQEVTFPAVIVCISQGVLK